MKSERTRTPRITPPFNGDKVDFSVFISGSSAYVKFEGGNFEMGQWIRSADLELLRDAINAAIAHRETMTINSIREAA